MDLVPSSSPFSTSLVLLPRKRVESASHILENCWGHLTSWQNMFPRIGGTWVRATLSGSVSISLSVLSRVPSASFYRPLCLRFRYFLFFFFSPLFYFSQLSFLCRGNSPTVFPHVRRRDIDGYCFARVKRDPMTFFSSSLHHRARELNSALFNIRERKRVIFFKKKKVFWNSPRDGY